MKKTIVLVFSFLLYVEFGLLLLPPIIMLYYQGWVEDIVTVALSIWVVVSNIILIIGFYGIFKGKIWGKNIFLTIIAICVFMQVGDALVVAYDMNFKGSSIASVIVILLFPLVSFWVLNYSDASEYFYKNNFKKIGIKHE